MRFCRYEKSHANSKLPSVDKDHAPRAQCGICTHIRSALTQYYCCFETKESTEQKICCFFYFLSSYASLHNFCPLQIALKLALVAKTWLTYQLRNIVPLQMYHTCNYYYFLVLIEFPSIFSGVFLFGQTCKIIFQLMSIRPRISRLRSDLDISPGQSLY